MQIDAGIDPTTGIVHWTLVSIDPSTGEPPANPELELLPPDDENEDGEGYVTFMVRPKADDATGTEITNQATITFD